MGVLRDCEGQIEVGGLSQSISFRSLTLVDNLWVVGDLEVAQLRCQLCDVKVAKERHFFARPRLLCFFSFFR